MKLIIEIPEDEYEQCKAELELMKCKGVLIECLNTALRIHIANGKPLTVKQNLTSQMAENENKVVPLTEKQLSEIYSIENLLKGNISRMCVTHCEAELDDMCLYAHRKVDTIYTENLKRFRPTIQTVEKGEQNGIKE